jgi:crossover junction endodeoxyribonuclease RuvC
MRRLIGIDPGLAGGLAVVEVDDGRIVHAELCRTPTAMVRRGRQRKREYDTAAMSELLACRRWTSNGPAEIVLELQGARPGQGVVSMFRAGVGFGLWWGIVAGLGLGYRVVAPGAWKRHHGLIACDKRASRLLAQSRAPSLGPIAVADEGCAEALLLALYVVERVPRERADG